MARTSPEAVGGILGPGFDPDLELEPFIETASGVVTRVCSNSGYDEETLELIERWLSAHFASLDDPRTVMEMTLTAQSQYETNKTGLMLDLTRYGQMAKVVDTAGNLAVLDNTLKKTMGLKPNVRWLGKKCDE